MMIASYAGTGLRDADASRGRLLEGSRDLLRAGEGLRFLSAGEGLRLLSSGEGLRRRSLHAHYRVAPASFEGAVQSAREQTAPCTPNPGDRQQLSMMGAPRAAGAPSDRSARAGMAGTGAASPAAPPCKCGALSQSACLQATKNMLSTEQSTF